MNNNSYEDAAGQILFGEAFLKDSADTVQLLNYPDSVNSPGHYDLLVTKEKQEEQPKDLPKAGIYVIIGSRTKTPPTKTPRT